MKHFEDTKGVSDRNRLARAVLSQVSHLSLILRNVDDFTNRVKNVPGRQNMYRQEGEE